MEKKICSYCGDLSWTIEMFGYEVHKEYCPERGYTPYHQGNLQRQTSTITAPTPPTVATDNTLPVDQQPKEEWVKYYEVLNKILAEVVEDNMLGVEEAKNILNVFAKRVMLAPSQPSEQKPTEKNVSKEEAHIVKGSDQDYLFQILRALGYNVSPFTRQEIPLVIKIMQEFSQAQRQRQQARNEAIQECQDKIDDTSGITDKEDEFTISQFRSIIHKELEKLKKLTP